MAVEAGGDQRCDLGAPPRALVEDFPDADIADQSVRVDVAAAGAVVDSGVRRGGFRFRRGGRGRDEPGRGNVRFHG